jgi:hypothetical protein
MKNARLVFVLVGFACAHEQATPESVAVMPDGRTAQVEPVAPEFARSRTWLTAMPTSVCSGPGECRNVIAMRPCPAPGTMVCFDLDQTKCIECGREKVVLRLAHEH